MPMQLDVLARSHRFTPIVRVLSIWALSFALWTGAGTALAQPPAGDAAKAEADKRPATAQTHPNNPEMWNVDAMMEEAVLQISRRYNLNKSQEEFTRLLLVKRTKAFLEKYEKDVRELLKESIDLRIGLKSGTPDVYKAWAERAAPVYEAAQKTILDGNEEWGAILNDEQKKIHESDVNTMRLNFTQINGMLVTWKEGKGPSGSWGATQTLKSGSNSAVAQPQPGGMVSRPTPPVLRRFVEDTWQDYVGKFIQTYKLDDKQSIAARDKILKVMRDEAVKYRDKHKTDFESVDAQLKSPKPTMTPKEIIDFRNKLERPVRELFMAMNRRLEELPDSKQRAAADAAAKKQLEDWYKMLAGIQDDKAKQTAKEIENPPGPRPTATTSGPAKAPVPAPAPTASAPATPAEKPKPPAHD